MIPMTPISNEPPTILIVDDYPANLRVLLDSLKTSGWKVIVATNGESALRQANFAAPDAILLDVMMPDMDGFDTCRRLKQQANTKNIPDIFMTALSDIIDKLNGFQAGGVDYITKPFDMYELTARIKAHVELKRTQEQLRQANRELQEANQGLLRYQQQLERMARIDPLTELANRRDMLERLEQEQKRSERAASVFAVILCDIDDFKRVNDTYGHDCGDAALIMIAKLLRANIRTHDLAARWGGEEFLLLLPDTDAAQAAALAERIRSAVAAMTFAHCGQLIALTMTFGVSMHRAAGIHACLKEADLALYQGKAQGKNRVVLFQAGLAHPTPALP